MSKLSTIELLNKAMRKKDSTITRVVGTVPSTIHNPNGGKKMTYTYRPYYG